MAQPASWNKVQVWVRAGTSFLLLKTNADRGGFWQPVTGSVEAGEAIEVAAQGEFGEETGLVALQELQAVSKPFEYEARGKLFREFSFLAEVDPALKDRVRLDPHEHTEFQWVSFERALELVRHESNARVLKDLVQTY
jgi:8-oxo-dGTP pyrophosphatase MutT (NUDIX family)